MNFIIELEIKNFLFTLIELNFRNFKSFDFTLASFGCRSLFYIDIDGELEQVDMFFLKLYLDKKWQ
jgi:hypothetical protein